MVEVSRRRVLAGVAWATTVILIATASPPAAASPNGTDPASVVWVGAPSVTAGADSAGVDVELAWAAGASTNPGPVQNIEISVLLPADDSSPYGGAPAQDVAAGWQALEPVYVTVARVPYWRYDFAYLGRFDGAGSMALLTAQIPRSPGAPTGLPWQIETQYASPSSTAGIVAGPSVSGTGA